MSNLTFSDVSPAHWAKRFIYFLTDRGIVEGVGNNSFAPDEPFSIAQLCAMAVRAAGIEPFYGDSWGSDPGDHWAKKYIDYVEVQIGLRLHNGNQRANVNDAIDNDVVNGGIGRQFTFNIAWQVVASLRHPAHSYDENVYVNDVDNDFMFPDRSGVLSYNREGTFQLVKNKVVTGFPDGRLGPDDTLDRAQAATIIARCIASESEIDGLATYYDIPLAVSDMPDTNSGQFEVTYDPQTFIAADLCVSADRTVLGVGEVAGENVNITRHDPEAGVIEFTYTGEVASTGLTGIVNVIRFRTVGDGSTAVGFRNV